MKIADVQSVVTSAVGGDNIGETVEGLQRVGMHFAGIDFDLNFNFAKSNQATQVFPGASNELEHPEHLQARVSRLAGCSLVRICIRAGAIAGRA